MSNRNAFIGRVDAAGRIELPAEEAARFGFTPGAVLELEPETGALRVRRSVAQLSKLYIEATSRCNLNCRTCVRNVWGEETGLMTMESFERIIEGLRAVSPRPSVFFGGFGEPLTHPHITEMVRRAKAIGCTTELISNGTLLTSRLSRELIASGLDRLWISLDGARPESYADVRLGAELPEVLRNLAEFKRARPPAHRPVPEIGIAFVAMRRNIDDLGDVLRIGGRVGATRFMVTNLLPYSVDMCQEILYGSLLHDISYIPSRWVPHVSLPKMSFEAEAGRAIARILRSDRNISLAGSNLGHDNDRCPFVEQGAAAVSWDGALSPCLPLVHEHASYLHGRQRVSHRYVVGRLADRGLVELFGDPEHQAFRERVQRFDFAPCACCGGCDMSLANEEDCTGASFPTCGGCLWAQGIIQCP